MKTPEKPAAEVVVAGLLFGGPAPGLADGGKDDREKDDRVEVILVENHAKSGTTRTIEEQKVDPEAAAGCADRQCDRGYYRDMHRTVLWVERPEREEGPRRVRPLHFTSHGIHNSALVVATVDDGIETVAVTCRVAQLDRGDQ